MTMTDVKAEVGDVVEVIFDDHVMNSDQIHKYTAYGRIHIIDDKQITIDCWHPLKDTPRVLKDEVECFTLMRSAVYEINVLGDFGDDGDKQDSTIDKASKISSISDML